MAYKNGLVSTSSHYPETKPKYPGYKRRRLAHLEPESAQEQSRDGATVARSCQTSFSLVQALSINMEEAGFMAYTATHPPVGDPGAVASLLGPMSSRQSVFTTVGANNKHNSAFPCFQCAEIAV